MNDPGLDEPIAKDAKDIEKQKLDEHAEAEEDEQAFLQPSRWWLASTAFPLIAGTFGPMASAFSICALVAHWRVQIPPGGVEEHGIYVDDPPWLIAVNSVQLAIALISNLFLLLNMARRVRFSIAQPITIIGWYLSSFTLVGLTACAAGPLKLEPSSEYAFTQAYYYALFSAALYFIVATLMLVTALGALRGNYDKEFQLTMSQRTLMLQTISFLVYLLAGASVYAHIESWQYLDAVYWANFTLLTIGIGDYSPTTHLGRALLFPFAIGGIIILGLVIGSIRSLVLERGKEKMGSRMVEKHRRVLLKRLHKKGKGQVLEPIKDDKASISRSSIQEELTERERREQEFKLMRKVQKVAGRNRKWISLLISGSVWMLLWFAGAAIFQRCEYGQKWSYFGSLYFAYTSLLTIGYGDFYPQSNSGKPFFVFWSLLAIPSLTILISNMGDTIVKGIRDVTLWVGNFTVLPGEAGIKATIKQTANRATGGRVFVDDIEESPPGILGESKAEGKEESHLPKDDPESAAQNVLRDKEGREQEQAQRRGHPQDTDVERLPESRRHYHVMLIKEIAKVLKHLNSAPPREYTYDEWAWYLKLIGEDEADAETHRKPLRKPRPDGEGLGATTTRAEDNFQNNKKKIKWSWLGNRSPLMGNKEEAEWVLERLTRKLDRELDEMHKEELEEKQYRNRGVSEDREGSSGGSS
ncbi:putative potassium channel [Coleophoma crateriformis]|uniref:Putative potassium channel n=1 Tax=Coleophoma crateriformis TaxID=565419 RepID=A0A3D8SH12_9HELO|nr:putative potassium channel [Coleophoma crateriformis]